MAKKKSNQPPKMNTGKGMKTVKKNHEGHRGDGAISEAAVIEFVRGRGKDGASVKDIAVGVFGGDYLKAKNTVRKPSATGMIVKEGGLRGVYVVPSK